MLRVSARKILNYGKTHNCSILNESLPASESLASLLSTLRLHVTAFSSLSQPAPIDRLTEVPTPVDETEEVVRSEVDVDVDEPPLAAALPVAIPPRPGPHRETFDVLGRTWTVESGRLARLADGAATLQCGGTTALATVTSANWFNARREATAVPLSVDYREKLYAVGRIPGTYNKREGAPKEHELLAARRIERALRPLLPRGYLYETDVTASILSADGVEDPEVLGINAASAAMAASDVPFAGPMGAVRVALHRGKLIVGPTPEEASAADATLLVAATEDRIVLLEIAVSEKGATSERVGVPDETVIEALRAGVAAARALVVPQRKLAMQAGRAKRTAPLAGADPAAARRVADMSRTAAAAILRSSELDCLGRTAALITARERVTEAIRAAGAWRAESSRVPGSGCVTPSDVNNAFSGAVGVELRALAVQEGLRPDGRGPIDLRPLSLDVDHVPVVHGSAVVDAGETQVLCTATVGTKPEQQKMESLLGGDSSKRLFVHFSLPEFAVGTAARDPGGAPVGPIVRHEMGRSEFVERALAPVLPTEETFPFTLRLNADALAADGGTGCAAVCGAALALADAGVPLRSMVAAVSIGLVSEGGAWNGEAGVAVTGAEAVAPLHRYELLTDPMGAEVALGDMELRVAGTATGITAAQLDVRLPGGIPVEVVEEALLRAKLARGKVLADMNRAVPVQRTAQSPAFGIVTVPQAMLGRIIGKEGSNIRAVEAATSARVQIGDDGKLSIFAPSAAQLEATKKALQACIGGDLVPGNVYKGTVVGVKDFGAFVALPGSDVHALLHVSEVATERIRSVEDVLSMGQEVDVEFVGRDNRGGLRVSRKAVLLKQRREREDSGSAPAVEQAP